MVEHAPSHFSKRTLFGQGTIAIKCQGKRTFSLWHKLTCLDLTYLEDTFCSKITLCLWPGGLQTTRYQINIFLQSIQLCQKVFLFIYAICSSNSVWVARQPFSHENKMKVGDVGLSPLCGHLNGVTNKCQYCAN